MEVSTLKGAAVAFAAGVVGGIVLYFCSQTISPIVNNTLAKALGAIR